MSDIFRAVIITLASAAGLTLLIALIAAVRRRRNKPKGFGGATEEWVAPDYKYNLKASLMTADESGFYFTLRGVLPDHYVVIPQLPLTAVVERPGRAAALSRIDRKSVDFGVFRIESRAGGKLRRRADDRVLRPIFLVEFDDETHSLSYREERDKFVNGLCRQIGLPLLRVPATKDYDAREVAEMVKGYI